MSTAIIYFGVPASGSQVVSEEISKRGLNLIRISPSEYRLEGTSRGTLPFYSLYTKFIPAFIYSAYEDTRVTLANMKFPGFPPSYVVNQNLIHPRIDLVFSFADSNDMTSTLREDYPQLITSKSFGHNIYVLPAYHSPVAPLLGYGPITTTKTGDGQCNIEAYKSAIRISRALDAFLRMHQYASFKNSTPTEAELWQEFDAARTDSVNMVIDDEGVP